MRLDKHAAAAMAAGLDRIRSEFEIPDGFPPEVDEAAQRAVGRAVGAGHVDRTGIVFATIDPAGSTDLDQAFAIDMDGSDIVLRYAIADVGWFVRPGRPTRRRGVESRRDRVSARPAFTVVPGDAVGRRGQPAARCRPAGGDLRGARRSARRCQPRRRGAGHRAESGQAGVRERAARRPALRASPSCRRGSRRPKRRGTRPRVAFPEQEIDLQPDDGFELRYRPRTPAEEQNAALSLAANLAIADALLAARTGLFRVMPEVDDAHARRLRHTAQAFGLDWRKDASLATFQRSLPRDPTRERRRSCWPCAGPAAGRATRRTATANARGMPRWRRPTRTRRHPCDACRTATSSVRSSPSPTARKCPTTSRRRSSGCPTAMAAGEQRANRADRAALDLAEAVVLDGCEGQLFDAVVTDEDDRGVRIQIADPAIVARVDAHHVDPGDHDPGAARRRRARAASGAIRARQLTGTMRFTEPPADST